MTRSRCMGAVMLTVAFLCLIAVVFAVCYSEEGPAFAFGFLCVVAGVVGWVVLASYLLGREPSRATDRAAFYETPAGKELRRDAEKDKNVVVELEWSPGDRIVLQMAGRVQDADQYEWIRKTFQEAWDKHSPIILENGMTIAVVRDIPSTLNDWIRVEDALPEESGGYLTSDGDFVGSDYYDPENGWPCPLDESDAWRVTHWKPWPKPPGGLPKDARWSGATADILADEAIADIERTLDTREPK